MNASPLVAGIELGGTKCVCLLASGPDAILDEVRIPTGQPGNTLATIADIVAGWHSRRALAAVGLASFGPLERNAGARRFGHVANTPKPGWSGVDLLAPLRVLGLPIGIDTDVNGAALAEGRWGAATDLRDFIYVNVGTGIGVGTIIDDRPIGRDAHSEAGHMRVARLPGDDWPGACPYHGDCVEGLASGPAIAARTGRAPEALPLDDPAWEPVIHALAALCHNLTLTVIPQRILIGGGIASGRPDLIPRVRIALDESLAGYGIAAGGESFAERMVSTPALGELAGPLGAVALALRSIE